MRTDEDLAHAFSAGDHLAFTVLYCRYKQPVYVFALRMLGDPEKARDVFQAAFLKTFESRNDLGRLIRFRSWIFTVVRNMCLNELRRVKSLDSSMIEIDELAGEDFSEVLERKDEERIIRNAIEHLKPEYREVLLLREHEGLTYEEIAEVTASTEGAVKSRLFKARQQLHQVLKPYVEKG